MTTIRTASTGIMRRLAFSMPFCTPKMTTRPVMSTKSTNHGVGPLKFRMVAGSEPASKPMKRLKKPPLSAASSALPEMNVHRYFMTQPPMTQ